MFNFQTRILVVDDFVSVREVMINSLKEIGFTNILQADDGEVGWKALNNIQPPIELVISDWNMPKMTGIEFLKKVRSSERFRNLPFLLVTTDSEKEQVIEAVKSGVHNYIIKPFTTETIRERLEAVYQKLNSSTKQISEPQS